MKRDSVFRTHTIGNSERQKRTMAEKHNSLSKDKDIEHLMRNAELRNQLEPYFDESISWINRERVPTQVENDFLASMLAWERAPVLPIADWFTPRLELPSPDSLAEETLHAKLWEAINQLFEKRVVLDFTDHLSDRELYCLIFRDILPSYEKKLDTIGHYLHWDCSDLGEDAETWLRYYASEEDREKWAEEFHAAVPAHENPPYPRQLPREKNS
jgi:hypothetical protein